MPGVLEGIRVLDFGRYIAGPFCGTMLGDLGAEVIRIEKLEGSEDRWVTPVVDGGEGAMFLQMGRNKLGLTLNPMKPEGREIVKKLVAVSDQPLETIELSSGFRTLAHPSASHLARRITIALSDLLADDRAVEASLQKGNEIRLLPTVDDATIEIENLMAARA